MTMKLTNRTTRGFRGWALAGGAAVIALLASAGCHSRLSDPVGGETFRPEDEMRSMRRVADVQAAAGARTDATLRAYHFDCNSLNSLGQEKLDLMLSDDGVCLPVVVYLDIPEDNTMNDRQDSIKVYLKDHGLTEKQVKLVAGINVNDMHQVAPGLKARKLVEGPGGGTNPEPAGSPVTGAPPAAPK